MNIEPFKTEQFFSQYEFSADYPLSLSDCETMSVKDLLQIAEVPLEQFFDLQLGYSETQGHPSHRQAIAKRYQSVAADDVMVLTSPVEGIYLTMRGMLDPDDEVVSLRPAYDALNNVARHVCKVVPWDLQPVDDGWHLDLDNLESLLTDKTKLVVVNFPQNPTGYLPDNQTFHQLIEMLQQRGIWLFCDEMYRGLEFGNEIDSAIDVYPKSIVLSGLSKSFGLAGLRSGWLVIKDHNVRERILNWKNYTTICPATPSEFLSMVALMAADQIIELNRQIISENLEIATSFFGRWTDLFKWRPPIAGSVAFVEMCLETLQAGSATEYCHQLAKQEGILLLPGDCLGYADNFVRIGLGRIKFAEALARYDDLLRKTYSVSNT